MGRKKAPEPPSKNQVANMDNTPAVTPPAELSSREQGDETATQQAAERKQSSWQPRTTIAVPLTEEAKRDHTKGEVARHVDGYNSRGVGVRTVLAASSIAGELRFLLGQRPISLALLYFPRAE